MILARLGGHKHKQRHNPEANREKRNHKVMKATRLVDPESSSAWSGIIRDLERDESLPRFASVPARHPVYVLDPHLVRVEFQAGFRAGFDFARAKEEYRTGTEEFDDFIDAKVGPLTFLDGSKGKRHLAAFVECRQLREERQLLYKGLGEVGFQGFQRLGKKLPPTPVVLLGTLAEPLYEKQALDVIKEVVDTAFIIHQASNFVLGPLSVSDKPEARD